MVGLLGKQMVIGAIPVDKATLADVQKALTDLGYTATATPIPNEDGVFSISASKGPDKFAITLMLASAKGKLPDALAKRLQENKAAVQQLDRFFLAVEGDSAKAKAFLDALVHMSPAP
ncbi:MAG: hypothetical protein U0271_46860 [Polyangiaceae bacterium]